MTTAERRKLQEDLMDILKTGKNTVYRYLGTGKIKSFTLGKRGYRIPKANLIEFLQESGNDHNDSDQKKDPTKRRNDRQNRNHERKE